MKEVLNIAVCQCGVVWEAPQENLARLQAFIGGYLEQCGDNDRPDLIVLPEFFATGFTSNVRLAEAEDGPTLRWMQALAAFSGAAVTGSVPTAAEGKVLNRMYFAAPDGRTEFYDKRHLFRMSGENEVFAPGSTRKTLPGMEPPDPLERLRPAAERCLMAFLPDGGGLYSRTCPRSGESVLDGFLQQGG